MPTDYLNCITTASNSFGVFPKLEKQPKNVKTLKFTMESTEVSDMNISQNCSMDLADLSWSEDSSMKSENQI
jgi:hypothetical protein